jgi:hypothetical protein
VTIRALHLLGNHPFLHRAAAADAVRFIAPLNRVAVVIGEVGKNLQQAGGDQRQQGNPGIKMALLQARTVPTIIAANASGNVLGRRLSSHA